MGMGISVTESQTCLPIWACSNQIQLYSPFIIYAMWLVSAVPTNNIAVIFIKI